MGGHGGLNILHQKKWNVYNLDNRMKVEKDRREHRQKKRKEQTDRRNRQTGDRLGLIQTGKEQPVEKKSNLITEELRKINEDNKHINLFEHEQRMIDNKEVLEAKIMAEREYLKDKSYDISSKFLGAFNDEKMKPWYMKTNNRTDRDLKDRQYQLHHIKKSESEVTKEVLVTESKTNNQRERSRSRSRDRQRNKQPQVDDKTSKLDRLRMQRQKREEKQRNRANQLIKQKLNL